MTDEAGTMLGLVRPKWSRQGGAPWTGAPVNSGADPLGRDCRAAGGNIAAAFHNGVSATGIVRPGCPKRPNLIGIQDGCGRILAGGV